MRPGLTSIMNARQQVAANGCVSLPETGEREAWLHDALLCMLMVVSG